MPLQTSGQISLSQIQSEYGGANNISISEYYNNAPDTTPSISTSRISKIRMKGVSGTIDQNAAIREFEFDGLGDWGAGDRRTGNNQIIITTNINTISDLNADLDQQPININVDLVTINSADRYTLTGTDSLENEFQNTPSHIASLQTINIIKGAELTLNINTTLTHPFIIVESKNHYGNDSNKYETGVTYSTVGYETNNGQITGSIIWDTSTSVLGLYYGICINHSAMYFVINLQHSSESLEPPLNSWINGSKELDSRSLMGNGLTINNDYYIEFDFVGSATKPFLLDFSKFKIYWNKTDISQDGEMGTWELSVYNEDNAQLIVGNITLTENNIITTVVSSGSSTDASSVTNLGKSVELWHDAQNIDGTNNSSLTNGSIVNTWNNLISASGITTYAVQPQYAPTYNGTGLYFNGVNAYNSTLNLNHYFTMNIFVVWKPNALHTNLRWLWGQDNGGYDRTLIMYAGNGTTHYVGRGDGGKQNATYTFTPNITVIVNCEYNASGQEGGFYINNSLNTSFTSLSPNGTNNTVFGARNENAVQYNGNSGITGDMYEIIIINRLLTTTERLNIYNYLDQKWISGGGGGSGSEEYSLEFNLSLPSAISSGGYVTNVGYIPSYSQPYVAINFSDFYYQAPPSSGPPTPVASSIPGASGGLGNTGYEIITGLYANNTTRTEGTTSFDNRGTAGRGSSNNVAYMNLIIQAKPGDVLNLIGRINTSGTYREYCEFWVWLGSSWSRFSSPVATFIGNRDFSVNYTIPLSTVAGNYALAVACSYYNLGSSSYRSWKSYSLHVWT
jgi:hypothetical protein